MALLLCAAATTEEVFGINENKLIGINSAAYSRRHVPRRGIRTMLDPPDDGIDVKLIMNVFTRNGQRKKWGSDIRGGGGSAKVGSSNTENRSLSGKIANTIGLEGREARHDDSSYYLLL